MFSPGHLYTGGSLGVASNCKSVGFVDTGHLNTEDLFCRHQERRRVREQRWEVDKTVGGRLKQYLVNPSHPIC
jgi:hypothetical protein